MELSTNEVRFPSPILDSLKLVPSELLDLSFDEIEKKANPGVDLRRLRVSFWLEYDRAARTNTAFSLSNIYRGIMTPAMFKKHVLGNSYRTLYLTIAPPSYQVIMEEMLHYGLMLERDILEMQHLTEKGVDIELLKLKQKIVDGVHSRVKGLPVSRALMVTHEMSDKNDQNQSLKDIDSEIVKFKKELGKE